ncbi:HK97 family phage prohead protease [Bacteroides sp.]|uniref:HK97 family phage prohead protease n=1 Tax=Bacteroides sp. TaxID=29523 RepID=UPI002606A470|nr:HK97 family phage prohead protease [Bacteroides sp.]MDD3040074.1 HK97 family phage prohead protease [Bacteroides sp.]
MKFDFCGWATRNDILCSDGRTIRKDAFKHNDQKTVPLVWDHQHGQPFDVLGHAYLENRPEGVYVYGTFNDTDSGQQAKLVVQHGDVTNLSIFANQLKQSGGNVMHGNIREVSLVLAGANPGACIESVISHGEMSDEEAWIFTDESISLHHSDDTELEEETVKMDETKKKPEGEETIADVYNAFNDKQKTVVNAMIGMAVEQALENDDEDEGGTEPMKHNVFENDYEADDTLSHSDMTAIFTDAKRYGSVKDSALAHGIDQIDYLFPDAANVTTTPQFIQREMGWVPKVMNGTHHTPFSRIKSVFADITEDDARAKGYFKGNLKKEEVFSLLKRTTTPTTVYKKQKMDRDDVVDITDFDVVAWLKSEMRFMLDGEIARSILIGDGRLASSDDKINEANIRPIWKDEDLYTIKTPVEVAAAATPDQKAKAFIRAAIKSRKNYKGSGEPSLFTTDDVLTDCLLMEDSTGRIIYDSVTKLATALRVKEIITVPDMENQTRVDASSKTLTLMALIVNLSDYNVGADKGGAVNMFDDFDIDYNAQKYLIETRCSGALTKPYSAIALELSVVAAG